MAKLVLRNCVTTVNGVDFSDHISSVEVNLKKKSIDTTNFSGGGSEQVAGLKSDQFVVTFQQDFAAAEVDATLYPLYNNETEFTVTVKLPTRRFR
jgi:FlaG/FlaF family flagellin (archaellin)